MVKVLSLFTGIGAFEKALDNLGIEYELVNYSEIDKFASKSYCAIHNVDESLNLGDITKINEKELPKDIDLITYGFPCQDISLAGKQKGLLNEDGTKTRSGLFFDALRIIVETQPRVAIAENVKNLVGKKFKDQFEIVLDSLEQAGYNNYWQVLNAKDYGIPQNRERVFIVSIRKDIDNGKFEFPKPFELKLRLKDMLEDEVDEKYYLKNKGLDGIVRAMSDGRKHKPNLMNKDTEYSPTLDTRVGNQTHRSPYITESTKPVRIGGIFDTEKSKHQASSVWDKECIAPTLDTMQGGYRQPCVVVKEATKKGYAEATMGDSINFEQPNSKTRRGRVGKQVAQTLTTSPQQGVVVDECGSLRTIDACGDKRVIEIATATAMRGRNNENGKCEQRLEISDREYANAITTVQKDSLVAEVEKNINENATIIREEPLKREGWHRNATEVLSVDGICRTLSTQSNNLATKIKEQPSLRIRKLTPLECFRLQGFDDDSFRRAEKVNSNTQLYRQAGNSICVPVIQYILQNLFECGVLNIE